MSITYKYEPEKDAIYAAIEGKMTFEEFQLTLVKFTEIENFPPNTRSLWDLRKMDFSIIDWDFSKQLVAIREMNPKRAHTRIAFIADKDFGYGITEMHIFQFSNKLPQEMRLFRDYEEGEKWLLEEKKQASPTNSY